MKRLKGTYEAKRVWKSHFGEIPLDSNGRKCEIHHIDGDKNNNNILNLQCVTVQEHYTIHYNQGDWEACRALGLRLNLTTEELKILYEKVGEAQRGKKKGPFPKVNCKHCDRLVSINTIKMHELQCSSNPEKVFIPNSKNSERYKGIKRAPYKEGIKKPNVSKALSGRSIPEEVKQKIKDTLIGKKYEKLKCPYCGKTGGLNVMKRWHFSNCKHIK